MAMYNRVVSVITKPPSDRTEGEISPLLPWFSKKSKLFENMKAEIMVDILRNCAFQTRSMDDVIIRQGERGDCFYIILSGKVSVYINTDVVPDDPNESKAVETDEPNGGGKRERLDRTKFGNYIVAFSDGRSFGELALINKDNIRNASIIADERTDLVVIDRDLFNRCLRAAQEADLKARQDFVNSCVLFNAWVPRYKRQAVMSLRKEVLQFDSPIVKQGDPLDGLYFIIRGQARVVMDILQHVKQYSQLKLEEQVFDDCESVRSDQDVQTQHVAATNGGAEDENGLNRKQTLWDRPRRRQGYAAAEQRLAKRNVEVSFITEGEIIGSIEQSMSLDTYAQTVICTQPTEIYILDAKNYERLVQKRNPRTMAMIRRSAEVKLLSPVASHPLYRSIPLIRRLVSILEEEFESKMKSRRSNGFANEGEQVRSKPFRAMDFIPQRGPIIDEYGPGTVFFRNKQLRVIRQKQERHRLTSGQESNRVVDRNTQREKTPRKTSDRIGESYFRHRPHLIEVQQFEDWETSGTHLGELEQKMLNWHNFVEELEKEKTVLPPMLQRQRTSLQTPVSTQRSLTSNDILASVRLEKDKDKSVGVVPLRRFQVENATQVKPGAKVVFRNRVRSRSGGDDESESESDSDSEPAVEQVTRRGKHRVGVNVRLDIPPPITAVSSTTTDPNSSTTQSQVKENGNKKNDKVRTAEEYQELKLQLRKKERELIVLRKVVF